jgi:hypothetical protein
VTTLYRYEVRLPLAPYRFVWAREPAVQAESRTTDEFVEERYTHADGTVVVLREYTVDGSFHVMSDRDEIQVLDHAWDSASPDAISVVRLP